MHWCKLTLICVAFLASTHGTRVKLTADKDTVKVGDSVTFHCEVYDMSPGQFVRWKRVVDDLSINLATNKFLETAFKDSGRFEASGPTDQVTNPFTFSLTINDVEVGDSGGFRCGVRVGATEDIYKQVNLTVVRDITEETFSFAHVTEDGTQEVVEAELVESKAGEELQVVCTASQVFPVPTLSLVVDGKEVADADLLDYKVDQHFQVVDRTLGVVEQWTTVTKKYKTKLSHGMGGASVRCQATMPDGVKVARSFNIKLDEMPPTIRCPETVIGEEWSYNERLSCNVTARPQITEFNITYHINNDADNKVVMTYGAKGDGGDYILEVNNDWTVVSLAFDQTFMQDFRKYIFTVRNSAGKASAEINFIRAEASAQYSVNVELSKKTARIGEDVKVTCSVSQDKPEDIEGNFPFIMWVKKVGDKEVEIGTNTFVNADFRKNGRYVADVDYEYDDNREKDLSKVSFELDIKDVGPGDSGEIGCRIPQQKIEVFRQFTVFVPPKSILLNSMHVDETHAQSYIDGTGVTFDEGHVRKFYCHVNGSFPRPTVTITIGDRDITDQFEQDEKVRQSGVTKGLEEISYAVTLKNEAFTIDYSFANKRLECKATLPGSGFPPKTTGINIKLAGYKPKFVCNKTMTVKFLQEDVQVKCQVHADPEIDHFRIYWSPLSQNIGNITLEGNSSDGPVHAHIENGSSATEKIMTLKIDRIFKQHFRKYYFEAGNDLGKESHTVELIRDEIDYKDDDNDDGDSDGTDGGIGIDNAYMEVHGSGGTLVSSAISLMLSLLAWRFGVTC